MKNSILLLLTSLFLIQPAFAASEKPAQEKTPRELVIYSSRNEELLKPLLDEYKKQGDIKIQVVNGKDGWLIQRIKREGKNSPADVLITVDAGNLWFAAEQGLLAPMKSTPEIQKIPEAYLDSKNLWTGLSLRARTIFYNKNKVKPEELSTYAALSDEKWKGRLCLRTSKSVYNQSLVAMMIHHLGAKKAAEVVAGWVKNLEQPTYTSDELLLRAIDSGACDVGIANTYYMARLKARDEAKNVAPYWPNQETTGVHVNVSGAGVVKSSNRKDEAQKFIDWLASKGQKTFALSNHEYPVIEGVEASAIISDWGKFKADQAKLENAGKLQRQAVQMMDKAGYR